MSPPSARPATPAEFLRELGRRWRTHWVFKMTGTTAFMSAFFVGYFATLKSPVFPVTIIPATTLDHWVTFRPESLPLYVSLWVYVALPPALLLRRSELLAYGAAAGGLSVAGLGLFFFLPTTIVRPEIDWTLYPSFAFLKNIDAAGNACPSLHVAFAVFSAFALDRILRSAGGRTLARLLNAAWCIGIVYSTLATKQHVVLDAAAGTLFGLAGAAWHRWVETRPLFAASVQRNCSGSGTTQA